MLEAFISDGGARADAYRLLAYAYRHLYGAPLPEIVKTPAGKPFFPAHPDIFFSLSHTRGRVMVCMGDVPCGCDIQIIRPVSDSVVAKTCAPEELAVFDFFELWTLKESLIKLQGRFIPYREMVFLWDGAEIRPPLENVRARLYPAGTHMAALCCVGEPPKAEIYVPAGNLI